MDLENLKALAEAALDYPEAPYLRCQVAFNKAANPATVLELIAEIDRLKNECGKAKLDEARELFLQLRNCRWNTTAEWQHQVGDFLSGQGCNKGSKP